MQNIDWPLAIMLAVAFVVVSFARWRYFRSRAQRRAQRAETPAPEDRSEPPAP